MKKDWTSSGKSMVEQQESEWSRRSCPKTTSWLLWLLTLSRSKRSRHFPSSQRLHTNYFRSINIHQFLGQNHVKKRNETTPQKISNNIKYQQQQPLNDLLIPDSSLEKEQHFWGLQPTATTNLPHRPAAPPQRSPRRWRVVELELPGKRCQSDEGLQGLVGLIGFVGLVGWCHWWVEGLVVRWLVDWLVGRY